MPTALIEMPVPLDPPRKRWTRAECAQVEALGLFDGQHYELISGELVNKMGKNRRHTNTLMRVLWWLGRVFGEDFVNSESSIDVSTEDNPTNEPEPDLIVLALPSATICENPRPEHLRLLVEVSDSSLSFDLGDKASLYARAGILDYWVFDTVKRRLIVHRDPRDSKYQSIAVYSEHESVAPLAAPGSPFVVNVAFTE